MTIQYRAGGKLTGVSGDTKPTDAEVGWEFYETDTDDLYVYTGTWDKVN